MKMTGIYLVIFTMLELIVWLALAWMIGSAEESKSKGMAQSLMTLAVLFGPSLCLGWIIIGLMGLRARRGRSTWTILLVPVIALPILTGLVVGFLW